MAQVYYFKSSLQHLKKQGVWIEGWKRIMFRERKRENVFLKIVLTDLFLVCAGLSIYGVKCVFLEGLCLMNEVCRFDKC